MPKILALSGGGGVAGPVSSTANDIPTFSGTTGQILQDSGSLSYSAPTLTISKAASGNAILALSGNTSGTATLTAPAIAGTTTNAVVSSNVISAPAGTKNATSFQLGSVNTGIYGNGTSAGVLAAAGTDMATWATASPSNTLMLTSAVTLAWSPSNINQNGDTALSRISAGVVGVGTGTQGNVAGQANMNILGLAGATSGTATLTAPAIAGTSTNPIVSTNAIGVPAGSSASPAITFNSDASTGIFFTTTNSNQICLGGHGFTGLCVSGGQGATMPSNGPLMWASGTGITGTVTIDTAVNRVSAGVVGIGKTNSAPDATGQANMNILGLAGATSGTATLTAPAIAGTATNAIVSSNVFQLPSGAAGTPSYGFSSGTTTGMFFKSSGCVNGDSPCLQFSANGSLQFQVGTSNNIAVGNIVPLSSVITVGNWQFDANNTRMQPLSDNNDDLGRSNVRIKTAYTRTIQADLYASGTRCASSASPAVCAAAPAGAVLVPTGTNPTLVVNTTAVTANSQIMLTSDESLGTLLSTTCNTTLASVAVEPVVTARTAGTSFTIQISGVISTNGVCLNYLIVN